MSFLVISLVSLVTGMFASLGLGGGMVLIIYLYKHHKNRLIEWKKIVPVLITGTIFVTIFSFIANNTDNSLLQKLFGGFVVIAGVKELFAKKK